MYEYSIDIAQVRKSQQYGSAYKTVYGPVKLRRNFEESDIVWAAFDGSFFYIFASNPFTGDKGLMPTYKVKRAHMYMSPYSGIARSFEYLYSVEQYLSGELKLIDHDYETLCGREPEDGTDTK